MWLLVTLLEIVSVARIITKLDAFGQLESLSYQYFFFSLKMEILTNSKNIPLGKSDLRLTKKLYY